MRTRYVFDAESGQLLDRDGNSLGVVVAITLDSGGYGGGLSQGGEKASSQGSTSAKEGLQGEPEIRTTPSQLEAEAIDRCWQHYLEVIPSRRKLDPKRKRFIRDAIRLVGEEMTKLAFTGLSRSPWHNGNNPEHKKWLDVRYALKGIGNESDDERIEKAITWASLYSPAAVDVDPVKIERWLEEVRYHCGKLELGSEAGRAEAVEAYHKLKAAGFTVTRLDKPPWARVSR